jgi:hypothetical protein
VEEPNRSEILRRMKAVIDAHPPVKAPEMIKPTKPEPRLIILTDRWAA